MSLFFLSQPLVRAATDAPETPLPTEFVLFTPGENQSVHGSVLFDARAAELVMAQAARHGVDLMIDLEHRALRGDHENDHDARGWGSIALRDGALWAVGVTWTEDGAARLRSRRQRYTSPAFWCDEYDDATQLPRVTSLINVAICAMPATYQIAPLVASALSNRRALDGVRPPAYAPVRMATSAPTPESAPAVEAAPEQPESPPVEAVASEPPPVEDAPEPAVDALSAAERAELEQLRAERNTRETAERRALVAELVALGAETPATAWSNSAPAPRLAGEPLPDLRSRVAALRALKPSASHVAPPAGDDGLGDLSDADRANAEKITDPKMRSAFIALRRERHQSQSR